MTAEERWNSVIRRIKSTNLRKTDRSIVNQKLHKAVDKIKGLKASGKLKAMTAKMKKVQ